MKVLFGINDHCVIQRVGESSCHCHLIIESDSSKPFSVNVFNHTPIETAKLETVYSHSIDGGLYKFKCLLTGIPVGGPYTIVITQETRLQFSDILVGDLYVLAGQSNMEGIGKLKDRIPSHPLTRAFYMDECWRDAFDPIHDLTTAVDKVHAYLNGGPFEPKSQTTGTGLGVSLGQTLSLMMQVPVGLIACAQGGTSMDQWMPNFSSNEGYGLYHMMRNRIQKAGGFVNGLVWYQGCSDTDPEASNAYFDKMSHWISTVRKEFHSNLPIVLVQIARCCSHEPDATYWNAVQKHQYQLGDSFSNLQVVSAIDLQMDDFIHISGKSQQRLGKRCAEAMYYLQSGLHLPTPRLKTLTLERDGDSWNHNIRLTFDNISGQLIANGAPNGFVLTDAHSGEVKHYIYHTELLGNQVLLKTTESALDLANCYLNYGHGFLPYCNITDEADRALPAFHTLKIGEERLLSAPCTRAWIANDRQLLQALSSASPRDSLFQSLLHSLEKYPYKDFGYYFLNSHALNTNALMYHMPFEVVLDADTVEDVNITANADDASNADDAANCDLLIGGSGDFEVFMDGQLIYKVTLTKPIAPDQQVIPVKLTKGKHLLSIWFQAYDFPKGIFVRFDTKQALTQLNWLAPNLHL